MRIRFSFTRRRELAYISHLDMLRLFLRALSRSKLPLAYSRGFNPHPRFSLALPLPLGLTAEEEFAEVYFTEDICPDHFLKMLEAQLPAAIILSGAQTADPEAPNLASLVYAALYLAVPGSEQKAVFTAEVIQKALNVLMIKEEILMQRKSKKNKIVYTNIRPYILETDVENSESEPLTLKLLLQAGSQGGASPAFVIEQLEPEPGKGKLDARDWLIHRKRLYMKNKGVLQPLSEGM